MNILAEIFARKRLDVEQQRQAKPLAVVKREAEQAAPAQDFVAALRRTNQPALIAEIKRASPSRGLLIKNFDPLSLACLYAEHGASAISVLTEQHYFQGHLDILKQIAADLPASTENGSRLPLLRKDFIFHPYQVYEARAAGADALLLIAAYLDPQQLAELHALTLSLGMAPLVEVHNPGELKSALQCSPILVGINNRDLADFSVDLQTTVRLRPEIPPEICVVSESGIHTRQDVQILAQAGVDAILVGEALVLAADIRAKLRELCL